MLGRLYHDTRHRPFKQYGEIFGEGDVIHVWLDLKENNDLSFGRNGKNLGKAFDIKSNTNYRLAIGVNGLEVDCNIEIVEFDILH